MYNFLSYKSEFLIIKSLYIKAFLDFASMKARS